MLILGRRANQSIVFPSCGITVRMLEVNGKVAKVGIEAGRHVEVLRGELVEANYTAASSSYTHQPEDALMATSVDEPLMQMSQRITELKAGLHAFQQLRARGEEADADAMLAEVLKEIALLDRDCLEHQEQAKRSHPRFLSNRISENRDAYITHSTTSEPSLQILIVSSANESGYMRLPSGCFHGCQISSANHPGLIQKALENNEPFDFIVLDGDAMDSAECTDLELAKLIRSNRTYDQCRLFVTRKTFQALEQVDQSNQFGIDGWLQSPLDASDLWCHVLESRQIDA